MVAATPVCDPTIDGTCMRKPAFTMRTKTVPEIPVVAVPAVALNTEAAAFVLLNAAPLIR